MQVHPVLGVLLHKEGTSFRDLITFMDDERNKDLVAYGQTELPNEGDRDFFKNQFHSTNFDSTKAALAYRFNEVIRDPVVREFLCNPSTIDLPSALQAGKLVVFHFDPDKQTKDAIKTIGQLVNAYLVSFTMRRPKPERRPIHLFADECQYFISPTIEEIMGESRKFGLYATLATQRTEQVSAPVLDAIFGNVGCYLIGRNKAKTAEKMAKEQPLKADDIRELKKLEFFQVEVDRPPVKTKIPIIGSNFALHEEAWRKLKFQQGATYYRTPSEFEAMKGNTPAESADYRAYERQNQDRQHQPPKSETTRRKRTPKHPIPDISKQT